MSNNVWLESLSEEDRAAYIAHRNELNRERYASDADLRRKIKDDGFRQYQEKRREAIEHLGGRCSSPFCSWVNFDGTTGCTDPRCLQIDHVNSDGATLRKQDRSEHGTTFYRKVLKTAPGEYYQLLCANCNWIKRHEKQELPQARHTDDSYEFVDNRKSRAHAEDGTFLPVGV